MARYGGSINAQIANPAIAQPVSAFVAGRAARMAFEQDQQMMKLVDLKMQAAEQEMQMRPVELAMDLAGVQQRSRELDIKARDLQLREQIQSDPNSNWIIQQDAQGYYWKVDKRDPAGNASPLTGPDGQHLKGPLSPEGWAGRARGEAGVAAAVAGAKGNVEFAQGRSTAYRQQAENLQLPLMKLMDLREKIAGYEQTGPTAPYREIFNAELQELDSIFNGIFMDQYIKAKQGGATFGALNQAELQVLKSLAPRIRNQKQANLAIMDQLIQQMTREYQYQSDRYNELPLNINGLPPLENIPGLLKRYGEEQPQRQQGVSYESLTGGD